ncbi:MAG TPA: hypothetical protein PKE40_02275 [Arachnia sp.]|nr:hypothetical protein [Arachnia sp.]HMT85156.1 hypothetical protein [Arachnia sp.]
MNDFNKTGFDRRAVVKGAAWSVPVVAAAAAMPLAAATVEGADLSFGGACVLQAAGISLGPGFELENNGNAAWTGTITFQEQLCVNSSIPLVGDAVVRGVIRPVWIVSNVLDFYSGVTASAWSWPTSGFPLNIPQECASRTVTFTGTLQPGERAYWGRPLSILGALEIPGVGDLLDLAVDLDHTAQITSITPATPSNGLSVGDVGSLDWRVLDGNC